MDQNVTTQAPADFKQLDAAKVEALRGQLRKMVTQGDVGKMMAISSVEAPTDHSSHTSDGW
jgi:hypothetical protein